MIAGGLQGGDSSLGPACRTAKLASVDINGDGFEDGIYKRTCEANEDDPKAVSYFVILGKDPRQYFDTLIMSPGILRFALTHQSVYTNYNPVVAFSASPTDRKNCHDKPCQELQFSVGDLVQLPKGLGMARIREISYTVTSLGKVLAAVVSCFDTDAYSPVNKNIPLADLKIVSPRKDLGKMADQVIDALRRKYSKQLQKRDRILSYADFNFLRPLLRNQVYDIDKQIFHSLPDLVNHKVKDDLGRELLTEAVWEKLQLNFKPNEVISYSR